MDRLNEGDPAMHTVRMLLLLMVSGLAGCATTGRLGPPVGMEEALIATGQPAERQVIQRARLRLTVADLELATPRVQPLIEGVGGHLESSVAGERDVRFVLRVPASEFDRFIQTVQGWGDTEEFSVSREDVTEALTDLEARIRNLSAVRDRLRSHLQSATDVTDIIAVERELARVQTELEILEGRDQRLRTDVAFSTVTLQLERKRVLGPVGLLGAGVGWLLTRLIFIR